MDEFLSHAGVAHDDNPPGRGSGRYAWGTGENPYQHQFTFLSEVQKLKKKGLTESQIAAMLIGPKLDKNGQPKKDASGNIIYHNSTDLRARISIERADLRTYNYAKAVDLLDQCKGNVSEVARRMTATDPSGKKWNESSVRSLLSSDIKERTDRYQNTADMLAKRIDEVGVLDVGKGVELYMGTTKYTKDVAIEILEQQGYVKAWRQVDQQGTGKKTNVTVLCKPGTTQEEITKYFKDQKVGTIVEFTPDQGKTWWTPEFPESISSKRIYIRYDEDGGSLKDGVIELRKGVEDISLGGSQYAQVRIAVDGSHYMKGMAIYGDIPEGYDIVYNTNKKKGTPAFGDSDHTVLKVMKHRYEMISDPKLMTPEELESYKKTGKPVKRDTGEIDRDNPFGATIKSPKDRDGVVTAGGQRHYIDENGQERLSPINKLMDEGDWDSWSRNLASQFLSKQPLKLIRQQLDISVSDKKVELEEIKALTNPVIKKKMLMDYAEQCDSNAADLSAKGFRNQAFQVLLPIPEMKDNEIYAPKYQDGDTVALIRYPHGGTFEIPILKVNNKQKNAKKIMGKAKDAVGINANVAERLSGADFDGDTALVIPLDSNNLKVVSTDRLKGLESWSPKSYKLPDSAPTVKNSTKQREMGIVTNLITDMTVAGAPFSEIERAVKHSMVVIDSEKHHLDYKKSAKDMKIKDLKDEYQSGGGASTILSRAKAKAYADDRKEVTDVKKMTPEQVKAYEAGKKVYVSTGKTKKKLISDPNDMTSEEFERYSQGKKVYRVSDEKVQTKLHQMDLVDDAMELVHDKSNQKEIAYANYANSLKELANEARKEARAIKPTPVSVEAKKTYASEVESLMEKLKVAQMNAPKERTAQTIANSMVSEKFESNPDMDYEHRQRERARALTTARSIVGAKKQPVEITDREWEAIQANAISTNKLTEILKNTDQEAFKKRATPKKSSTKLTNVQIQLIEQMSNSGMYTQSEIAERLGVSVSTVNNYL